MIMELSCWRYGAQDEDGSVDVRELYLKWPIRPVVRRDRISSFSLLLIVWGSKPFGLQSQQNTWA